MKSLSHVRLFATPWTVAYQAPPSMGFSRRGWSGLPFPSPEDLPDPEIEPGSPISQADALPSEPPGEKALKNCVESHQLRMCPKGGKQLQSSDHAPTRPPSASKHLCLCSIKNNNKLLFPILVGRLDGGGAPVHKHKHFC